MTTNDALTTILKQFQSTGDIEQAKEDIKIIMDENPKETVRCIFCGALTTKPTYHYHEFLDEKGNEYSKKAPFCPRCEKELSGGS